MKLAIFGATGTVGSELLTQALDAGHDVRVLVRTPSKLPSEHNRLAVVQGNVKDPAAVKRTVDGCDAVLSTLGAHRGDDHDTRRTGTENVIAAMRQIGIQRLVAMGGFHLAFPDDPTNFGRKLIVPIIKLMGIVVEDTTAMGSLVLASDLDWTLVRSPRVVNGRPTGSCHTGTLELGPWNKVTRGDVASFMLRCLTDDTSVRQAPMISDRRRTASKAQALMSATRIKRPRSRKAVTRS
jgi:putative NADH-flavin reductase